MTEVVKKEDGHFVYFCANCNRQVNAVFYIGSERDTPAWLCDMCVTSYRKPK